MKKDDSTMTTTNDKNSLSNTKTSDSTTTRVEQSLQDGKGKKGSTFSHQWSALVKRVAHRPVLAVMRPMARTSALYPKLTIAFITVLSFGLLVAGFFTNFNVDVDTDEMWTPIRSYPVEHMRYIDETFAASPRYFVMFFHAHGDNVLTVESVDRAFVALDTLRSHPEYHPICNEYGQALVTRQDGSTYMSCDIYGVTRFWWNNRTAFHEMNEKDAAKLDPVAVAEERYLHTRIAKRAFPDQFPVLHEEVFGYLDYNVTIATSAKSFTIVIYLPEHERTRVAELEMVHDVLALNQKWQEEDGTLTGFRVEALADESIGEELIRAVNEDIPLIPIVFVAMSLFTAFCFARRHAVYSRAALGAGAVVSVMFSIMSGFGLLFIIGSPFTPITQLLPFLIFGIGLDDAFIIIGSYVRMDPKIDVVQRIEDTVNEIGLSIFLTTFTSAIAFVLGCTSSIPAVFWLCQYCFPTVVIVFIYQMTFFVACITLDERRIQNGRCDILCCVKSKAKMDDDALGEPFADRIMEWYARQLVRPWIRVVVVIGFTGLFGVSCYSTTLMRQKFKLTDVLPRVSHAVDFLDATFTYQNRTLLGVQVVFRDVNQSDPLIRQEMKSYVKTLTELDFAADSRTETHWMSLFDFYLAFNADAVNKTFNQQLDEFLSIPFNKAAVGPDIARDDEGNVIASRVRVKFAVDLDDVKSQIKVLKDQLNATLKSPLNEGREDRLAAFTFDMIYTVFEFYVKSVSELMSTTILGVFSVTAVALLFIPHWTASVMVCPLTCVLYIDLLGVMKWGGLAINSLTFISLTMSIGLLVDYIMHVLFRYYELPGNRVEKTIEMLRTMGSSVLLGGVTTFLGTLPLYFTSSDAFRIIFVSFVGIVTLGIGHGLILLPVILATIGPEDQVSMSGSSTSEDTRSGDALAAELSLIEEDDEEVLSDDDRSHPKGDQPRHLYYTAQHIEANQETQC